MQEKKELRQWRRPLRGAAFRQWSKFFFIILFVPVVFAGESIPSTCCPDYTAIGVIMGFVILILAYIGRTSDNVIIKMFFSSLAVIALTGLCHIAYMISNYWSPLDDTLTNFISWFTVTFGLVSMFLVIYTLILMISFLLGLVANIKRKGITAMFNLPRKDEDQNPFK